MGESPEQPQLNVGVEVVTFPDFENKIAKAVKVTSQTDNLDFIGLIH